VIGTERGREACASVKGTATPVVLELSDFDSVVACAKAIRAFDTPIDVRLPAAEEEAVARCKRIRRSRRGSGKSPKS
jgi:hypothetical protein